MYVFAISQNHAAGREELFPSSVFSATQFISPNSIPNFGSSDKDSDF
jgi:hypothetical protein